VFVIVRSNLNGLKMLITATFWSSKQNGEWIKSVTWQKLDSNKRKSLQGSLELINSIPSFESNQTLRIDARSRFTTIPYVTVATKEMFKLASFAVPSIFFGSRPI